MARHFLLVPDKTPTIEQVRLADLSGRAVADVVIHHDKILPPSYSPETNRMVIVCCVLARCQRDGKHSVERLSIASSRCVQVVRDMLVEWRRNKWKGIPDSGKPHLELLSEVIAESKWIIEEMPLKEAKEVMATLLDAEKEDAGE